MGDIMFGKPESYGDFNHNKYPAELREIAEIIASNQPQINIEDVCNCLIDLWLYEQKYCIKMANNCKKPKCRKLIF